MNIADVGCQDLQLFLPWAHLFLDKSDCKLERQVA